MTPCTKGQLVSILQLGAYLVFLVLMACSDSQVPHTSEILIRGIDVEESLGALNQRYSLDLLDKANQTSDLVVAESSYRFFPSQDGIARFAFHNGRLIYVALYSTNPEELMEAVIASFDGEKVNTERREVTLEYDLELRKRYVFIRDKVSFAKYVSTVD